MKNIFKDKKGFENKTHIVKVLSCTAVLCTFAIVGLCFFARPSYSEAEKRNLTEFPKFTFESFFSGEYFSQISLWYSDTYPFRESMISANSNLQSLYGNRDDELVVPVGNDNVDIENAGDIERFDKIWIQSNTKTAYEIFINTQSLNDRYADAINQANKKLSGATVYNMVVPLHYTYKLTDEQIKQAGGSDCVEVIDYIYSQLEDGVKTVDAQSQLLSHKDEYIYYRTDHHWTALGAYYAYVAFCEAKGITPTSLDEYEKYTFDGFLGTFYTSTNNKLLEDNPDYVEAFVPKGTNEVSVIDKKGNSLTYPIVRKNTDSYYAAASSKYNCFIAGDHPVSTIHNPEINDGSSIVVIKESYGNAFVPFLVDSYEYVYVIDYRYYDGSLVDFVEEKGIDDVLFLNYISTTSTEGKINQIASLLD